MRRVIIVVEGQTEQEFVKLCIAPYLLSRYNIYDVSARLIGKPGHKGGDVRYTRLKADLSILSREPDVVITTFIDFFKMHNDFPLFEESKKLNNASLKIEQIELGMKQDISNKSFIPYIQCHEFEALLFASTKGFEKYFKQDTVNYLKEVNKLFPNPEDINSNQPPSYRLISILSDREKIKYNKVVYGNILALENGIDEVIACCPRFANWLSEISEVVAS